MATKETRVNEQIRASRVRLIDAEGKVLGVVDLKQAIHQAKEAGLDLVEVSGQDAEESVCRFMDFGKLKYKQSKSRKKQKRMQVKEIKFRPGTEEQDYQVKKTKLQRFLEVGHKIKVTVRFRGREMAHQELGIRLIERLREDLESDGVVEQMPKFEGRQLVMMMAPKKK